MSSEYRQAPEHRLDVLEQRMSGLTQAVAAITTELILRGVTKDEDLMRALKLCETDLLTLQEPTHASEQVREVIQEVHRRLPVARREWD